MYPPNVVSLSDTKQLRFLSFTTNQQVVPDPLVGDSGHVDWPGGIRRYDRKLPRSSFRKVGVVHSYPKEMKTKDVLRRIGELERELERIKKDLMHLESGRKEKKPSLFGSVRGGDVTDEMIEEAKKDLFRAGD